MRPRAKDGCAAAINGSSRSTLQEMTDSDRFLKTSTSAYTNKISDLGCLDLDHAFNNRSESVNTGQNLRAQAAQSYKPQMS